MIKLTNKIHIDFDFNLNIWCFLLTIAYHNDDYWDEKTFTIAILCFSIHFVYKE